MITNSHMVAHTHDVLHNAERVLAIAVGIEIGQRGYALTGDKRFLAAYTKGLNEVNDHVNRLLALTADNIDQQKRITILKKDISELLEFSSTAVEVRSRSFEEALQLNASLKGKNLMDNIRKQIAEIENEENQLLRSRMKATDTQIEKYNYAFITLLFVTGAILAAVFYGMNVTLKTKAITQRKLISASREIQDLYDNAPCGYHSLDNNGFFVEMNKTLLQWLGYERHEILNKLKFPDIIDPSELPIFQENFKLFKQQGYIHNLEFTFVRKNGLRVPVILSSTAIFNDAGEYLRSRSITIDNTERKFAQDQINLLNHELESFSYSVSHDLRAPLRSIDGYARILQEDYSEKFDSEGQRLIQVIMNNAKRMGRLIDDLLDFSRLGRKDVAKTKTDMNAMVNAIVADVVEQEKKNNRTIDVKIHDLHPVPVDVEMIRQVWINLIDNAVKYTGKTAHPRIEISSAINQNEVYYQVKDNGVGFDMLYVEKLFGVFQRLHKMQDFSGTGVGLAIVKRIINRHHGKVWAEGKLNEGATFYFTLPMSNGKQ
jgi:PAS domain S-box-containing protein